MLNIFEIILDHFESRYYYKKTKKTKTSVLLTICTTLTILCIVFVRAFLLFNITSSSPAGSFKNN